MAETPRGSTPREGDRPVPPGDGNPPSPGSRSARTKAMHDSGQYRDKIPVEDPAASPLGTDSEASGFPAGEGSMEPAAPSGGTAPAGTHPPGHARGDAPGEQTSRRGPATGTWIGLGLIAVAVLILLFAIF